MATTLKNTEFPSIGGVVGSMVMVSEVQSENAETPILTTPSGIVIKLNELQSLNAESLIIVTLDGIFINSSALQPTKADFSSVFWSCLLVGALMLVLVDFFQPTAFIPTKINIVKIYNVVIKVKNIFFVSHALPLLLF